jgi:glycerol-3-phosphate acyltransferase PlsX
MHIKSPRVGLLSIGAETEKGNELTQQAYPLISEKKLNFIGNVEGGDLFTGRVDVVVCDGFVGNVILKISESLSTQLFSMLKEEIKEDLLSKVGALLLKRSFRNFRKKVDYDEHGAAPLLGIDGIVFKAHGRARAKAIKSAIRVCAEAVKENVVESIREGI